jgi:Holliday junction resolvase RusA-like endonuclease
MGMVLKFTIPGHPTPAVRMTQKGKFVDPAAKKYLDYKSQVAWVAKGAMTKAGLKTMMEGPIEVIAVAYI